MLTSSEWDRVLRPDLTGKVAIVTGAASGMGASIASALAHVGAKVALVDRNAEGLEAVRSRIEEAGGQAIAIAADLADPQTPEAAVKQTAAELGGLNIVVSAAGVFATHPIGEFPLETYNQALDINLRAPFLLVKAAQSHLSAGDSVVLISSGTAVMPSPFGTAYAASKGGINALTRSLSAEFGPLGVRVNSVSPGFTETPMVAEILDGDGFRETIEVMTPNRRIGQPEDVAATVVFLVSDGAVQIIGEDIAVDGGVTKSAATPPARSDA